MATGTVKWFNPTKGYGFIQPQDGGKDVFVHISAVERAGLSSLNEGQVVEYELVSNRGKQAAENLKMRLPRHLHQQLAGASGASSRLETFCKSSFATTMSNKLSGC